VFERIKNVFNAALGKSHLCGGNCLCNKELESPYPESDGICFTPDPLGDFIDLRNMDPTIKAMLIELSSADKQAELLKELEAQEDAECGCGATNQQSCVHLDYIPVCHMKEGDAKPETCAASTCPVRAFQVALEEMQKKAAMIAYG
jgi:hypothetical protein